MKELVEVPGCGEKYLTGEHYEFQGQIFFDDRQDDEKKYTLKLIEKCVNKWLLEESVGRSCKGNKVCAHFY